MAHKNENFGLAACIELQTHELVQLSLWQTAIKGFHGKTEEQELSKCWDSRTRGETKSTTNACCYQKHA